VLAALRDPGGPVSVNGYVRHADAVRLGQALLTLGAASPSARSPRSLFSIFSEFGRTGRTTTVPLALSSTLHLGLIAFAVFATFNLAPRAATIPADDRPAEPMRLVFLATPGPGGGGGGGGLQQKAPPPKAMRRHAQDQQPLPPRLSRNSPRRRLFHRNRSRSLRSKLNSFQW
jgi:hypothetical protein